MAPPCLESPPLSPTIHLVKRPRPCDQTLCTQLDFCCTLVSPVAPSPPHPRSEQCHPIERTQIKSHFLTVARGPCNPPRSYSPVPPCPPLVTLNCLQFPENTPFAPVSVLGTSHSLCLEHLCLLLSLARLSSAPRGLGCLLSPVGVSVPSCSWPLVVPQPGTLPPLSCSPQ